MAMKYKEHPNFIEKQNQWLSRLATIFSFCPRKSVLVSGQTSGESFSWMMGFPFVLVSLGIALEYSGFDVWWISHFYDANTQSWPFRDHWLFDRVIHGWGRRFDMGIALMWLLVFFSAFFFAPVRKFKKNLIYFLLATAAGPLIVGAGKQLTHIYTPWDLTLFSGTLPYIRVFDSVPSGLPVGEAFPAGHAAGGYAFFSLYFVLRVLAPSYKKAGFVFGLMLGLIFGIGQQVRGAHFPSHDLFTMAICWLSALFFHYIFYPKDGRFYPQ